MQIPVGYHEHITTPAALRGAEAVWSFVASEPGNAIILPDGRCDILFRFHQRFDGHVSNVVPVLTGPATRPYTVHYDVNDAWLGLRLHPSKAHMVWGDATRMARNQILRGADIVRCQLQALVTGGTAVSSVSRLSQVLMSVWTQRDPRPTPPSVTCALRIIHIAGGRISIANLSRRTGTTERHLSRLFQATVGVSPKAYAQLVQFHRALRLIRDHHLTPSATAFEAGYADQSHMTRSFQTFGGFTPRHVPETLSLPGFSNQI